MKCWRQFCISSVDDIGIYSFITNQLYNSNSYNRFSLVAIRNVIFSDISLMKIVSKGECSETIAQDIKPQTSDLRIDMEEINNIGLVQDDTDSDIMDNTIPQSTLLNRTKKSNRQVRVPYGKAKRLNKTPHVKRNVSKHSNEDLSEEENQDKQIVTGLKDKEKQVVSIKSTSNVSDVEDSSDRGSQQNQDGIQKTMALLTNILTIPLVRIDDPRTFIANNITPKFSVVGDNSEVQTYIVQEEDADFIKQEVKEEVTDNVEIEDNSNSDLENTDPAELSSNSGFENVELDEQSSSSELESADQERQSLTTLSQGSWVNSSRTQKRTATSRMVTQTTIRNRVFTRTTDNQLPTNNFTTFLQNTGKELRAMPLEDALELQAQMEQLIQLKRLSILQRRTGDLRQTKRNGENSLQTTIQTATRRNDRSQNSSIIYMRYNKDDDEDALMNGSAE